MWGKSALWQATSTKRGYLLELNNRWHLTTLCLIKLILCSDSVTILEKTTSSRSKRCLGKSRHYAQVRVDLEDIFSFLMFRLLLFPLHGLAMCHAWPWGIPGDSTFEVGDNFLPLLQAWSGPGLGEEMPKELDYVRLFPTANSTELPWSTSQESCCCLI